MFQSLIRREGGEHLFPKLSADFIPPEVMTYTGFLHIIFDGPYAFSSQDALTFFWKQIIFFLTLVLLKYFYVTSSEGGGGGVVATPSLDFLYGTLDTPMFATSVYVWTSTIH